ncbi:MAG: DUF4968 domain-containing protein [Lachnospiraceae bacterium]|nr:DUF4968 domain-containing protein [Lachnospiraceae bacterium]
MLSVTPEKSACIIRVERKDDCLYLYSERGLYRIEPKNSGVVRVTYTEREFFSKREKPGVINTSVWAQWDYRETPETIEFFSQNLRITVDRKSASFSYYDGDGVLLLRERERDSRKRVCSATV